MTRVYGNREGIGFRSPIVVKADPRPDAAGDSEAAIRRLGRLSIPGEFDVVELDGTDLVVDFALFRDEFTEKVQRAKAQHGVTYFDKLDDQLQRGGATNLSCAYLTYSETHGDYVVSEWAIRLPSPPGERAHQDVAEDVAELVAEIRPPSAETGVWVRQKTSDLNGSMNSFRRGQNDFIDAMDDPYPHIGAEGDEIRLSTFAEFVADVKRAYDEYTAGDR